MSLRLSIRLIKACDEGHLLRREVVLPQEERVRLGIAVEGLERMGQVFMFGAKTKMGIGCGHVTVSLHNKL